MGNVLILGDFNLHFDMDTSSPAVSLLSIIKMFNFTQHVSGPTPSKGHTLELIFSLGLHVSNLGFEDAHLSDHSSVL